LESKSVAYVCLRSWKRISGSLDYFRSGLNERRVRLWRLRGAVMELLPWTGEGRVDGYRC
jgi:hypothetical protein